MSEMRDLIHLVESWISEFGNKTLPEIKVIISNELERNDLSEEERDILLNQYGVLDDMNFDQDGNLTIYRAMDVTLAWIKKAKPSQRLGIYWSHDPNTASPYDANTLSKEKQVDLLIEAILPAKYVDWNLIWHLHERGENEIRLGEDHRVPLKISRIWINGKLTRLPNWNNKVYTD